MSMFYFALFYLLVVVYDVFGAIDNKCLQCICKVESQCRDIGCRIDAGSLSCGFFQIKRPYYIDCGQPEKTSRETTDVAWKRCSSNYNCAQKCINAYMDRYASRCRSNPNCEIFAKVHNGGPNGCKSSATTGYWNKVNACYR